MAEVIGDKTVFTLKDVTRSIGKAIEQRFSQAYWVRCEINKLNYYRQSGHCYPDLVEKEEGSLVAEMRGVIWKGDYQLINRKFLKIVGEPLRDGIKVLMQVRIGFDAVRGISLRIIDIDPMFALGELELEKKRTIERLQTEDLFKRNKTLSLPLLPKRIALLSVETSKGYADFTKTLQQHEQRYNVFCLLFPTLLQGDKAAESLIIQLRRIKSVSHHFDAVAIVRGGGGEVGLSCYNDYTLAKEIAGFPLPVLTGIGHSTNETVCEMISYHNAITPTALAEFLIQKFEAFAEPVKNAERVVGSYSMKMIKEEKSRINSTAMYFRAVTRNLLDRNSGEVQNVGKLIRRQVNQSIKQQQAIQNKLMQDIRNCSQEFMEANKKKLYEDMVLLQRDARTLIYENRYTLEQLKIHVCTSATRSLDSEESKLALFENTARHLDPVNVLKRGFSYTLVNGKLVRSVEQVSYGDELQTFLADGRLSSTVSAIINYEEDSGE
jgi:exodeoxyribonuclease VII large subunit